MTRGYEPCTRWVWLARIWPAPWEPLRRLTASNGKEGAVNGKWICLAIVWPLLLTGCNRSEKNADPNSLFVSGRIDGDTVDISSKRDGKIVEIMVREGDTVEAGQVVARIVSPQDEAQVEAQKASVIQDQRKLE